MRFIAFTTKGLEFVAEDEITSIPGISIIEKANKRIIFESDADLETLAKLRTVDDLGLLVYQSDEFVSSDQIKEVINRTDLMPIKAKIADFRQIEEAFSITPSVVGVDFRAEDLVKTISELIQEKYGWQYTERDHSNFDIRIFVDHSSIYVSVRLTRESLHHRPYKVESKEGSLKPTVAAAMVRLATKAGSGLRIVDNFCGSGTILCEAYASGNEVFGGDIDSESVNITRKNLASLGYKNEEKLKILDATRTNWQGGYFDVANSNLPWGKQIEIASISNLYEGSIKEYSRILKGDGVLCAIISKPDLFVKYAKKYFPGKMVNQYKIGLLGQTPTIVLVS